MGRRRKDKELPKDVPSLVHRIAWLLKQCFNNNIAWMAKALGSSHAALSRVLAGQMPSGRLLEALARRADVNAQWLLTGEAQGEHGRPGVGLCPIADTLLPGQPANYPERLSPVTLPMASPFRAEAAYWYRVRPDDAVTLDRHASVAAGDFLLVEASERWTRRPEAFAGRMVALRRPEGGDVVLAKVAVHEDTFEREEPQHEIRMFGPAEEAVLVLRTRAEARAKPVRRLIEKPGLVFFFGDDVVGVVLQVSRLLERGY
jgi:hypothetical protein